jgi:hypothetical protein
MPYVSVTPLRAVLPEQFSYALERETTLPAPLPVLAALNEKFAPPRLEVMYGNDPRSFKMAEAPVEGSGAANLALTAKFTCATTADITDFCAVNQSGVAVAVALESGTVLLVSPAGQVIFEVRYDGAVIDFQADALRMPRVRRSFSRIGGSSPGHTPACSCVSFTDAARSITIGYRDGFVQVYDLVHRKVCRRLSAHGTVVSAAFVVPGQQRVVSVSVAGSLRFDSLFGRTVQQVGKASIAFDDDE